MTKGVGIHNQDKNAPVALVPLKDGVEKAVELCEGLKNFDPSMKVLVKPNLAAWIDNYPFPPFGVLVTGNVMESIIVLLKEAGAKDITIGEGSVQNEEWGSGTDIIYNRLGYQRLVNRYGVKLVDFNKCEHIREKFGGFSLRVAPEIFETDFCINFAVFKTHQFTTVSLGFKNFKGVLHQKAKRLCHHHPSHTIDEYVSQLGTRLYPNLTIIDGTYFLERGAMHTGRAHRAEVLLAGRDMFSCDVIGSHMLGVKDISAIEHLRRFAEENQRSLDIDDIEVRGLAPGEHVMELERKPQWLPDGRGPEMFEKQNIRGLSMNEPDQSLCTGAGFIMPVLMMYIASANRGVPFDDYEFLVGRKMKPSGRASKTFLVGDCAIASNRKEPGIKERVEIPGCAPTIDGLWNVLTENGIEAKRSVVKGYLSHLVKLYEKKGYPVDEYYIG